MYRGTWWVVLLALGCSSSVDQKAAPACTPGAQQACACVGGAMGAQRCREDGSGFAECICPDGGAAELGSGGLSSGSGGSSSLAGGSGGPAVDQSGGTATATGGASASGGSGTGGFTGGAFSQGGSMGTGGVCAGVFTRITPAPVNLIFIVDKTGSMGAGGGQSASGTIDQRWNPMIAAFTTFFNSVTSPALKASVTFFPAFCNLDLDAGGGCVCDADEYNPTTVQVNSASSLPLTQIVGHTQVFADLFNNNQPNGGTPTIAALQGSYTYASSVQAASVPGGVTYVVLVTDGAPGFAIMLPDGGVAGGEGCPGNNFTTIAALAQSYANQGIKTYVFRLGTIANLDAVATAGGTVPVTIPIGDAAATTQQFITGLNAIPKPVFACNYRIDTMSDPNSVNVFYTNNQSSDLHLIYDNPSCGRADKTGWYMDTSANELVLCPATCDALKADASSALSVQLGCPTQALAP